MATPPVVLDFYPLQDVQYTRISKFFENLREGKFTTTKCSADGSVHWPPRVVCPQCHGDKFEWIELPMKGRLYAFSALNMGLPLGMESQAGSVVGLVELEGSPLRIFSRIAGAKYEECRIGDPVELKTYPLPDGRIFYHFVKA